MADKELKSVRIRPINAAIDERLSNISRNPTTSGALGDVKVTIFDQSGAFGKEKYEVGFLPISERTFSLSYNFEKKDQYKDYTLDDFIKLAITQYAKYVTGERKKGEDPNNFYEIIQNPWQDKSPLQRKFGFDKYVLNNGSRLQVKWFEAVNGSMLVVGGSSWSDENGKERDLELGKTQSTKGLITKKIEIYGNDVKTGNPESIFTFDKNRKFSKDGIPYEWSGNIKDIDIIKEIISEWKKQIVNYNSFGLCEVEYRTFTNQCDKVPYISPLGPEVVLETPVVVGTGASGASGASGSSASIATYSVKMNIVFPADFEVKAREDVPEFQIYIGDVPKEVPVEGFVFGDDEMTGLDPEYTESDFVGAEENIGFFQAPNGMNEAQYLDQMRAADKLREEEAKKNAPEDSNSTANNNFGAMTGKVNTDYKENGYNWAKIKPGMTDAQLLRIMVDYIEGGYYYPATAYNSKGFIPLYNNSGETLWGIDRYAGATEKTAIGKAFWGEVDKLSGHAASGQSSGYSAKTPTKNWDANKYPNKKGGWTYNYSPTSGTPGYDIMYKNFVALAVGNLNSFLDQYFKKAPDLKKMILSDSRFKFMYFRATWNGPGWFSWYAGGKKGITPGIVATYNGGMTNIEDLIIWDLNQRIKFGSGLITHDVAKMCELIGIKK